MFCGLSRSPASCQAMDPPNTSSDWRSTWGVYHRSYKGKRIHGGRAFPAFKQYMADFSRARTPAEKMIVIDILLHAVHEDSNMRWVTPAACNLIEGKRDDTLRLLYELAYGPNSTSGVPDRRNRWLEISEASEIATRAYYQRKGIKIDGPVISV